MTLDEARRFVGQQIGLPLLYDGSSTATKNLSPDDLVALTRALIDFIKNNPSRFTNQQVATANAETGRFLNFDRAQAQAESVSFLDELAKQAEEKVGKPLAAVGEGVSRTVTLAGNLLPVVLIVAAVVIALPYLRRATAPTASA